MDTQRKPVRYHRFILIVWQESGALPNAPPVWRLSLENPHSGVRSGFKGLADFILYLQHWTDDSEGGSYER